MSTLGIIGAGLMGRMFGLEMAERGWQVTLFDKDSENVPDSVSSASAGMIAPSCELESAERDIAVLGSVALERWPGLVERLGPSVDYHQDGSIVVAHPRDRRELERLRDRILSKSPNPEFTRELTADEIRELEPEINPQFRSGLFMTFEAHVDNREVLKAAAARLVDLKAQFRWQTEVTGIEPGRIEAGGETHRFDWVADCRGMGARADMKNLRGVRGELAYVQAPEVHLGRPVRLMHPRYPIYIVPRKDNVFVIGATALESEDYSPISLRSAMELMSAAYTVHTGFAEARILETLTNCRPALPDNRPRIQVQPGLLSINGLYRHGFLLSPVLSEFAAEYVEQGTIASGAEPVIVEEGKKKTTE